MPDASSPTPALPQTEAQSPPSGAAEGTVAPDEKTVTVALSKLPGNQELSFAPAVHRGEVGQLGRYRVLKELGRGGMGAVFLAFDHRLERKVALKVMRPRYADNSDSRERFLREARTAAMVKSDHVVTIFDVGEEQGIPFIAMEYLLGCPLDQYLKTKGELPLAHAMRIGREAALGLAAAHNLGLVHRDIKPGNLWLEAPKGRVKLLDFGLARIENDDLNLTHTGAMVGTPAYMSPEQARGQKVDYRSDLFSLGVLLYRIVTGEMPFKGNTATAILTSLAVDTPAPVRQLKPELPEALETLLANLLAKDPAQRPASAKEVAQKLRSIEHAKVKPDAQQPGEPAELAPLVISAQTQYAWEGIHTSPPKRQRIVRRRNPLAAILAGIGVLPVVAVFAFAVIWSQSPPSPQGPRDTSGDSSLASNFQSKSTNPVPPALAVDLLAMVDVKRDTVSGRWNLVGGKLICGGETAFQPPEEKLQIPYSPPPEYDLTLVLERTHTLPNVERGWTFAVYLTDPHQFILALDHSTNGKLIHGLGNLDGKRFHENDTTTIGNEFEQGKKVRVECRVRRGSVTVLLDGKERIRWVGDMTRLQFDDPLWLVPNKSRVALGVHDGEYHVHEWKLIPVGRATNNSARAAVADPDRRAAEYVLSIGGWVQIDDKVKIATLAELPNESFTLKVVNLYRNQNVTDAGLVSFKDCRMLTYLVLQNTNVSDEGLVNFKSSAELSGLNLGFTQVGDAGLAHFKNCKKLNTLALGGTRITDLGLANFKDCNNLKILLLDRTQVGDEGLANFKDGKSLVELNVKQTKVSAQGIAEFAKAQPQCRIEHDGGTIEPTATADPDRKAAEWVLSIGGGVKVNSQELDIRSRAELPTDRFLLTAVTIRDNVQAIDDQLAVFKDCTNLASLYLWNTQVTDAGLVHFERCLNLKYLSFGRTRSVGDTGLANFKNCKQLMSLQLSDTAVTSAGLDHFQGCKDLLVLLLYRTRIGDAGLANFKDCKKLKHLDLGETRVTDAGLANFVGCGDLEKLALSKTAVGDDGLAHFHQCKNLTFLNLSGTLATDAGLARFKDRKLLTELTVQRTTLSARAIAEFSRAQPQCRIVWDGGVIEPK